MGKVHILGEMEGDMKENINKIRSMVLVHIFGLMEENI
jgi:hypothetical protein